MNTRRGFLGFLAGLFAAPGIASAKAVISDQSALLVIELGPEFLDPDDERIARMEACFVEKLKGTSFGRPIFVSTGMKIKALPGGGVYHRERIGNVELEIIAKTEEELKQRLDSIGYSFPESSSGYSSTTTYTTTTKPPWPSSTVLPTTSTSDWRKRDMPVGGRA